MSDLKPSPDQQIALDMLFSWFIKAHKNQFITLGGFAGTGKTTLISLFRKKIFNLNPNLKVAFIAYTGKASTVLSRKLKLHNAVYGKDTVSTIHSLIYSPVINDRNVIIGWEKKEKISKDLIILDEASMVDSSIWHHLIDYKIPIVAIGDHGQLPPITQKFNLISSPDIILNKIHRQAETNPIIGLSVLARNFGYVRPAIYSESVKKFSVDDPETFYEVESELENYNNESLFLCGLNSTRKKLNSSIRQKLLIESEKPIAGDRVICLRNNHKKKIFNGMLGTIECINYINPDFYEVKIIMDDTKESYEGTIFAKQFSSLQQLNFTENRAQSLSYDLFDFGYAVTVHKSQGSQAKKVILFEERFSRMTDEEWKKWLYTAITRASEELVIFGR